MESFIISNYKIEGRKKNFVNTFWKLPSSFRTLTYYFCAFQLNFNSIRCFQFSSVAESCPTLCNPMDCSIPGFPVHHQLLEPTQTPVHCVRDGIQPSHPLSSPSPPTFNLPASGSFPMSPFFASGGQSNGVSASEYSRLIPLGLTGWLSFQSKGFSRIFSNTTVQKHQFFSAQLFFMVQLSHHTWPLEKP